MMTPHHHHEAARHAAMADRLTTRARRPGAEPERLLRMAEFHRAAAELHAIHADLKDQNDDD